MTTPPASDRANQGAAMRATVLERLPDLLTFDAGDDLVLSVYLNVAPDRQIGRGHEVTFVDLVRQLESQLNPPARECLERESKRVQEALRHRIATGKSVALFSCTPRELWIQLPLPVLVAESVSLGRRPYLRPLLDVLDEHERYAVALVDKEKARLFTIFLGEIDSRATIEDLVPGKHEQGGWSQANFQRHHEAHVYWHLKRVAEGLSVLLRQRPFDRLVLAGPDEATSELRRILPRPLQQRLVATVPAELFLSEQEILEKTRAIEEQVEREAEKRLVDEVIETSANGGRAIYGLGPTVEAVWLGRVHHLLVAEGLRLAGSECPACGWVGVDRPATCPSCGAAPTPFEDIVERLIERTLNEGGRIEIVHGEAERKLRDVAEGLGALLRY
ncbi:MAG: Vms1/Ankzf1 family peptidyl-tRNA hydrolase [Chloroflexota bacterium]|nr:Vms1/Ankzf1 family peptidyl-tRNA hydrolase [Dehalococcoidia bacterium]MDW8255132.1 Vms1/Ankzf1 family peptidyl-tRNA hydrolase [Chloroflexota bacterium]